jgi:transportin-3
MAANGQQVFDPVLAAHNTMSSQADRAQKEQAHQYLEQFQKSVCRIRGVMVATRADVWL